MSFPTYLAALAQAVELQEALDDVAAITGASPETVRAELSHRVAVLGQDRETAIEQLKTDAVEGEWPK